MPPKPYDPALLREHAYHATGNLLYTIPENLFERIFHGVADRGLGLFLYHFPVLSNKGLMDPTEGAKGEFLDLHPELAPARRLSWTVHAGNAMFVALLVMLVVWSFLPLLRPKTTATTPVMRHLVARALRPPSLALSPGSVWSDEEEEIQTPPSPRVVLHKPLAPVTVLQLPYEPAGWRS